MAETDLYKGLGRREDETKAGAEDNGVDGRRNGRERDGEDLT